MSDKIDGIECDVLFCYHNKNDKCYGEWEEGEICHVREYYKKVEAEISDLQAEVERLNAENKRFLKYIEFLAYIADAYEHEITSENGDAISAGDAIRAGLEQAKKGGRDE